MIADYEKRLEIAKNSKYSNCIGTALFLAGITEEDNFISTYPRDYRICSALLRTRARLEEPIEGALAAWEIIQKPRTECHHLAVVVAVSPSILVTHRDGSIGPLVINVNLDDVRKVYDDNSNENFRFGFYTPFRKVS